MITAIISGCNSNQKTSRVDALPYYSEASFTPNWFDNPEDVPNNFHHIKQFTLTNQNGKSVTEKTVDGKICVVDFFFTTCPGICRKMTKNMLLLQDAFEGDSDVLLLSHTVTPERDSVGQLKAYAEIKGIKDKNWHLLTGDRKLIYDLGRNYYFAEEDLGVGKDEHDFLHTENFILIDQNRRIRGIYNGLNKNDIEQIIADIKTLKKEG